MTEQIPVQLREQQVKSPEFPISLPSQSVQFQLLGYGVVHDRKLDPDPFITNKETKLLEQSSNPVARRLLAVQAEKDASTENQSAYKIEENYWKKMHRLASEGNIEQFEQEYTQWLEKRFNSETQDWTTNDALDVLRALLKVDPDAYARMITLSFDIRQKLIGTKWQNEDYSSDIFERSLADWAKEEPDTCEAFVSQNHQWIGDSATSYYLGVRLVNNPEYGWSVAEKLLQSENIGERSAVYQLIDSQVRSKLKEGKKSDEFMSLFEKAVHDYVSDDEADSEPPKNEELLLRFIKNNLSLYLAICEVSSREPIYVLQKNQINTQEQGGALYEIKKSVLLMLCDEVEADVAKELLITGNTEAYFSKQRTVSLFSNEGPRRISQIIECLQIVQNRQPPNLDHVMALREEVKHMVTLAFSDPSILSLEKIQQLQESSNSGDKRKMRDSLYGLYIIGDIFDKIDTEVGAYAVKSLIDLHIAPDTIIVEHFCNKLEPLVKSKPNVYLELSKGLSSFSDDIEGRRAESLLYEATWQQKYIDDADAAWAEAEMILENGGDWESVVGIIRSLDAAFKLNPGQEIEILENIVTQRLPVLIEARKKYLQSKEILFEDTDINIDISTHVCEGFEDAAKSIDEQSRISFIYKAYAMGRDKKILRNFDPLKAMGEISIGSKRYLVKGIHLIDIGRRGVPIEDIAQQEDSAAIGSSTANILETMALDDPFFTLGFIASHRLPASKYPRTQINEIIATALCKLPIDSDTIDFESKIVELNSKFKLQGHETALGLIAACVTRKPEAQLGAYQKMKISLEQINAGLDVSKKTNNTDEFIQINQERIAKLMLLYPNPAYATSLIIETAKQHGFARVQARLELVDSLSLHDTVRAGQILSKRNPSQMHQGLLIDVLGLYTAYRSNNATDAFFQTFEVGVSSPDLVHRLGQQLLVDLAKQLGLDPGQLPSDALEVWNLDYLPKLFEAVNKFSSTDKDMYSLIVKMTMRGEFQNAIDPNKDIDLSAYTANEQRMILEIRNHNKLTAERFEQRNISLEAFHQGAQERRLTGQVIAEQIITKTHKKLHNQVRHTLSEAQNIIELNGLSDDISKALYTLDSTVDQIVGHISEERVVLTNTQEMTPEQVLETWEQVFKKALGKGKAAEGAVLGQEVAMRLRKGNFIKAFTWKDGHLASISSDVTAMNQRVNTLQQELGAAIQSNPEQAAEIAALSTTLESLQRSMVSQTEKKQVKTRKDIKDEVADVSTALGKIRELVDVQLAASSDITEENDALKLLKEHLGARISDVEKLRSIVMEAKDASYDFTLRRWRRSPGRDIFQGNYSSCCIAVDGQFGFGILRYLTGHDVEMTEVVDTQTQEGLGQTFEFVSENRDGTLSYTIDNCELAAKVTVASDVIQDALFDMAQETAQAMTIDPSKRGIREIIMGTNYNDVDIDNLAIQERTLRKVAGPMLGLKQYLDVFANHQATGVKVFNPGAFLSTRVATVSVLQEAVLGSHTERISPSIEISTPNTWTIITQDIMRLEKDTFGITADSESNLGEYFSNENNVGVIARNSVGEVIGYTLGIDKGDNKFGDQSGKELNIISSAVDWNLASSGVNSLLQKALHEEAKRKGYAFISRTSMADNGYAQSIIIRAQKEGILVEPKSLEEAKYVEFFGRPQINIVTRVN